MGLGLGCTGPATPVPDRDEPAQRVLWLWERPEDLRFLSSTERTDLVVAPLLGTLRWTLDGLQVLARRQPWSAPADMPRIAVVRIESTGDAASRWTEAARVEVVDRILAWLDLERRKSSASWQGLQIDFDARQSERELYRAILQDLRRRLDPELELGMTALVSWCTGDPWIRDLPIDEAVPMYFRMGDAASAFRARAAERDVSVVLCRRSYGLSTDEPWVPVRAGRRLFVFHPRPWEAEDLSSLFPKDLAQFTGGTP